MEEAGQGGERSARTPGDDGGGGLRPGEGGSRADCCPPRIVGRCCRGWLGARRQCGQAEILRGREERPWETPGHEAQSAEPPLRIVSPEPVCPPGTSVSSRGRAHGTRTEWGVRPPWCGFGGVVYSDQRFPRAGLLLQLSPAPLGCPSTFTSVHSFVYSTTIPRAPPAARGSGRGLGVPWQVGGTPDLPPPPAGHHGH